MLFLAGMLVNGFINVSISSLEKRFGFKSSETGVMSVGYDIAFCCFTVFLTYFAARSHRPRIVGIGIFVFGLGAMTFWIPHYTTPLYEYSSGFGGKKKFSTLNVVIVCRNNFAPLTPKKSYFSVLFRNSTFNRQKV